jgi:hypothetical protein
MEALCGGCGQLLARPRLWRDQHCLRGRQEFLLHSIVVPLDEVDADGRDAIGLSDHEVVELQACIGTERNLGLIVELQSRLSLVAGL